MDSVTKQWLERADYDLETARHLLQGGRYLYVAFMCQQSLEKLLKAYISSEGFSPPFLHNLLRLAEEAKLLEAMPEEQRILLADLNPYYIKARYGEYKESLSKVCTAGKAELFLRNTGEFHQWLKARIK